MRDIKFRAWDTRFDMMIYQLANGYRHDFNGDIALMNDKGESVEVSNEFKIMQYTGLKDRNGKEIYEGDLLQIEGESGNYNCFEVFYHDNECIGGQNIGFCINRMHCQGNSGGGTGYKFTPESIRDNNFVVCGDIYQNPELITP